MLVRLFRAKSGRPEVDQRFPSADVSVKIGDLSVPHTAWAAISLGPVMKLARATLERCAGSA
jgi:hypothetical protein